jgi:hypothetical protein
MLSLPQATANKRRIMLYKTGFRIFFSYRVQI